jgi:limonene-1,2-epoxide hydrolase
MAGNSGVIDSFMKAWGSLDIEAIMDHFTDDAAYANIPMGPPHMGKAAIRTFIEGFLGSTTAIDFVVHHQVEGASGVVMNERTDNLVMDGKKVALPVMGVFEFSGGKISAWRDYFDLAAFS